MQLSMGLEDNRQYHMGIEALSHMIGKDRRIMNTLRHIHVSATPTGRNTTDQMRSAHTAWVNLFPKQGSTRNITDTEYYEYLRCLEKLITLMEERIGVQAYLTFTCKPAAMRALRQHMTKDIDVKFIKAELNVIRKQVKAKHDAREAARKEENEKQRRKLAKAEAARREQELERAMTKAKAEQRRPHPETDSKTTTTTTTKTKTTKSGKKNKRKKNKKTKRPEEAEGSMKDEFDATSEKRAKRDESPEEEKKVPISQSQFRVEAEQGQTKQRKPQAGQAQPE